LAARRGLLDLRILVMLCGDLENCGRISTEIFHLEKIFVLSLNSRAQTQGFDLRLNSPQSHVAIDA
jgi:hypothetical protein